MKCKILIIHDRLRYQVSVNDDVWVEEIQALLFVFKNRE